MAEEKGIAEPVLPRRRKLPKRCKDGLHERDHPESVQDLYRKLYFEAFDLVTCGITDHFDQPGYKVYSQLKKLLVRTARKEQCEDEFKFVTELYKEEL